MSGKHDFNFIKKEVEKRGFTLLEDKYVNATTKMKVRCCKGHITLKCWDKINQGRGCSLCSSNQKKTLKEVKEIFSLEGYHLISDEYINAKGKLDVICDKGHKIKISLDKFKNQNHRCERCFRERNVGENHHNWNPDLDDEERLSKRDTNANKLWRKAVYERDDYTCRKCNQKGVVLNAHHIVNYSTAKTLRFDLDNGITLCEDCHKQFHKKYGRENNDEWQVKEFLGGKETWTLMSINS